MQLGLLTRNTKRSLYCDRVQNPEVAKSFILARFELPAEVAIGKIDIMKITKNIGMLLLAVYLIVDGLLGFGLNLGPAIFLLYLVALAAGVFILIGK
jgi:hypothetical protein